MKLKPLFFPKREGNNRGVTVTWGVPWKKGELQPTDVMQLMDETEMNYRMETWWNAFWPDGSVKWSAHTAVVPSTVQTLELSKADVEHLTESDISINEQGDKWQVQAGRLAFDISKQSQFFIQNVTIDEKRMIEAGKLRLLTEECFTEHKEVWFRQHDWETKIIDVIFEQVGLYRTVIKLEGTHLFGDEMRLPFSLRLYVEQAQPTIRYVHTFTIDGSSRINDIDEKIKGIGVEWKAHVEGKPYNRSIRVATENGWYQEASQLLTSRKYKNHQVYQQQIAGQLVYPTKETEQIFEQGEQNAIWNDYKLSQRSASHYHFTKSTARTKTYIEALSAKRARGGMYIGGDNGGLLVSYKNFWRKYPSELEVRGLAKDKSSVITWFWPPDEPAMNLEHYTDQTHVESAYEGFHEWRGSPVGISNTSEGAITLFTAPPSSSLLDFHLDIHQERPLLICDPSYYIATQACGPISAPDTDHPVAKEVEATIDEVIQFYKSEMDQRNWYGFWHYGDVMHSYDSVRHQWYYDLGGFAWQNSELVPNLWLWFQFFRKPSESLFQFAEAMTRHTSEVDQYHSGPDQGFGSRHNVTHWGCGCKEVRISMASLHKYYFYLTSDERTAEILDQVKDVDQRIDHLPPMRDFYDQKGSLIPIRTGPDWTSFLSNWLYQWERRQDQFYEEKIRNTIHDIKEAPLQLLSGPVFYYDRKRTKLIHMGDGTLGDYHMIVAFGGPQVWLELDELLQDSIWSEMLATFGHFYLLSDKDMRDQTQNRLYKEHFQWPMFATGIAAYAAHYFQDQKLAEKVWDLLLVEYRLNLQKNRIKSWKQDEEMPNLSTNAASQWCLNAMMCLKWIPYALPAE
ncbi:hypothetical protein J416_03136 [Gracilibacillus halophilus YIM-C55.5]|uniref:Tat pathway signal sequence domain protein n=1 Tax=Gracilibacillus halophilus YIM-C55.5 TaxID=1308866 RepID=N4WF64_9BACI|nr:hypothetical protein [Gracilibacillus halophilus]ENH97914.1 hypothetical protein J416_03136 [Gracilibacillus halophilus YIM-C55.5]